MALVSNQWLRPEYRARDSGHLPVAVSLTREHEPYNWKRANDISAVFRVSQTDQTYKLLALHHADVDLMFVELSRVASKAARVAVATTVLSELPAKEFRGVLASALTDKSDAAG
jgi:hypothetical protein